MADFADMGGNVVVAGSAFKNGASIAGRLISLMPFNVGVDETNELVR